MDCMAAALGVLPGVGKAVCVTGASGYIASHLIKQLLERGYTVRGLPVHSTKGSR